MCNRLVRPHLLLVVTLILLFGSPVMGCESELDPGRADEAYMLFRDALFAGNGEGVWLRTDQATHDHFQHRYTQLVQMDKLIESYLPQTDHRLARRQSGVELIDAVSDGRALFLRVFDVANFPQDEAILFGSEVGEIQMSADGNAAAIITRGEQQFMMVKSSDGQWYVSLLESGEVLSAVFAWLDKNVAALEQTVEDLIAEERTKREVIIAELMNIK
jgi:hypothetical protein